MAHLTPGHKNEFNPDLWSISDPFVATTKLLVGIEIGRSESGSQMVKGKGQKKGCDCD